VRTFDRRHLSFSAANSFGERPRAKANPSSAEGGAQFNGKNHNAIQL
jgi:hypothetical protein